MIWIVVIAALIFLAFGYAGLRVAALVTLAVVVIGGGLFILAAVRELGPAPSQRAAVPEVLRCSGSYAFEFGESASRGRAAAKAAEDKDPALKEKCKDSEAKRIAEIEAKAHRDKLNICVGQGRELKREIADRILKLKLSRQEYEAIGETYRSDQKTDAMFRNAVGWSLDIDRVKLIEKCTPLWNEGEPQLSDDIARGLADLRTRATWDLTAAKPKP